MHPFGRGIHGHGWGGRPHRGDGPHGGDGRRGRRRVLDRNHLQLILLSLIARRESHGYDLIGAIEELSNGAYAPSPGVVYPALALLADLGHVSVEEQDGGRRVFSITAAGQADLDGRAGELEAILAKLNTLASLDPAQHAPVRRAMENLKMVLGNAAAARVDAHEIAARIDEAARQIERIGTASTSEGKQ